MAFLKISDLPVLTSSNLISSSLSIVPVVSDITGNAATYKTSVANIKSFVGTGNLNVTGAVTANLTSTFANVTITGNLNVQGTTTTTSSQNLSTNSSIIDLHTFDSNLNPWTSDDGRDIGLRFFWYKGSTAGTSALVWENSTSALTWYGNGVGNANTGAISGNLGSIHSGTLLAGLTTAATSPTTGAIISNGGAGISGNIYSGGDIVSGSRLQATGNISTPAFVFGSNLIANTAIYTNNYLYAGYVQTNNSGTFGTTLNVQGTATVNALASNTTVTGTTGIFGSGVLTTTLNANSTATVASFTSNGNITLGGNIIDTGAIAIQTSSNGNISLEPNGTGVIVVTKDIRNGQANATGNIGSSTNYFNTVFAKATSAQYADLAEIYQADTAYDPGTVVIFGGVAEVTVTDKESDTRVAGAVSTDPAYLMNTTADGVAVALRGKIPVKIIGPVNKGDLLVTSATVGHAVSTKNIEKYDTNAVFAKSLETNSDVAARTIWAVIL